MENKEENRSSRSILKNRDFMLVWAGQTVSVLGDSLFQIALMWWVLERTGSTALMATVAILIALPTILLGPFAGTYADRADKRILLIFMDWGRGLLLFFPAALLYFESLQLWHVYILAILLSSMTAFSNPAINSFVPLLVQKDSLTRANSLIHSSRNLSGVLGPALGGILMALFGAGLVLFVDGLTFLFSAIALILVRSSQVKKTDKSENQHFFTDLWDGFKYIKKEGVIFGTMVLFSLINFFIAPMAIFLPVVVKDILMMGPEGFGFLMSSIWVGMLLGTMFLGIKGEIKKKGPFIIGSIVIVGLTIAIFGISTDFLVSILVLALAGIFFSFVNTLAMVVFQTRIPHAKQGRVFGTLNTAVWGLRPISLGLAGILAELFQIQWVIFTSGVLVILGGVGGFFVKSIRRM